MIDALHRERHVFLAYFTSFVVIGEYTLLYGYFHAQLPYYTCSLKFFKVYILGLTLYPGLPMFFNVLSGSLVPRPSPAKISHLKVCINFKG